MTKLFWTGLHKLEVQFGSIENPLPNFNFPLVLQNERENVCKNKYSRMQCLDEPITYYLYEKVPGCLLVCQTVCLSVCTEVASQRS